MVLNLLCSGDDPGSVWETKARMFSQTCPEPVWPHASFSLLSSGPRPGAAHGELGPRRRRNSRLCAEIPGPHALRMLPCQTTSHDDFRALPFEDES